MGKHGLFILAFAVVIASLIKSQMQSHKKSAVKKPAVSLAQWPGLMKKSVTAKFTLPALKKENKKGSSEEAAAGNGAPEDNTSAARQKSSVLNSRSIASVGGGTGNEGPGVSRRKHAKGYASTGYYYGGNSFQPNGVASASAQRGSLSKGGDSSLQELSSFTRTPDLSINVGVDPELAESFEDQIRKFREQNQLTSQELQELEVITNTFLSMSGSVQRGQVTMPQVNAEAIKITRSFINLKRRVEGRTQ